jgi:hypothetical protein
MNHHDDDLTTNTLPVLTIFAFNNYFLSSGSETACHKKGIDVYFPSPLSCFVAYLSPFSQSRRGRHSVVVDFPASHSRTEASSIPYSAVLLLLSYYVFKIFVELFVVIVVVVVVVIVVASVSTIIDNNCVSISYSQSRMTDTKRRFNIKVSIRVLLASGDKKLE